MGAWHRHLRHVPWTSRSDGGQPCASEDHRRFQHQRFRRGVDLHGIYFGERGVCAGMGKVGRYRRAQKNLSDRLHRIHHCIRIVRARVESSFDDRIPHHPGICGVRGLSDGDGHPCDHIYRHERARASARHLVRGICRGIGVRPVDRRPADRQLQLARGVLH